MNVVLLINMPTTCEDCPCYDQEVGTCRASDSWKTNTRNDCPLRSLPRRREMFVGDIDKREVMLGKAYLEGWNDCLEEIMGEIE